jgi:hypothetical protein
MALLPLLFPMPGCAAPLRCSLPAVVGGALKRTTCGRWAHPGCALWLPETVLETGMQHQHLQGLVDGMQKVRGSGVRLTPARWL